MRNATAVSVLKVMLASTIMAVVLFAAAGRLDWLWGWVHVILGMVSIILTTLLVEPDLLAERSGIQPGSKRWDIPFALFLARIGPLALLILAGLDQRGGWTDEIALGWRVIGLVLLVTGYALGTWAMRTNRFFSGLVRIQVDRGHTVVDGGPYRLVRHPGYMASILYSMGAPLLLGSLWAFVPAALMIGVVVIRTSLEDRALHDELPGYRGYANRTRYRLLPGVW